MKSTLGTTITIIAGITLVLTGLTGCGTDSNQPVLVTEVTVGLPPTYEEAHDFSEGLAWVKNKGKWGALDLDFNQVIDFVYDDVLDFSEGRAAVKVGGLWGFVDQQGNLTTEIIYSAAKSYSEGLAAVAQWEVVLPDNGVIDLDRFASVPDILEADELPSVFGPGVRQIGIFGFIDLGGEEVIPQKYRMAASFEGGVGAVQLWDGNIDSQSKPWVLINAQGEIVKELPYSSIHISAFHEGRLGVGIDDGDDTLWGFVDSSGSEIVRPQYGKIYAYDGGLAGVVNVERTGLGLVDPGGDLVVPLDYQGLRWDGDESELIAATKGDLWGYVDRTGKEILVFVYDDAHSFKNGRALVSRDGRYLIIDETGAEVATTHHEYEEATAFDEGVAIVTRQGLKGCLNIQGEEILAPSFDEISEFHEGRAVMIKDGQAGFLSISK